MAAHPPRTLLAKQDSLKVTPYASAELLDRQEEAPHLDLTNRTTPSNGEIETSIAREAESISVLDEPVSDESTVSAPVLVASESLSYPEPSDGQLRTWHSLPLDSRSGSDAQDLPGLDLSPPADLSPSALISFDLDFLGPVHMETNPTEDGSMEIINTDQATHDTHRLDGDVLQDGFALPDEYQPELPISENANSQVSLSAQPTQGPQLDNFDFNALLLQHCELIWMMWPLCRYLTSLRNQFSTCSLPTSARHTHIKIPTQQYTARWHSSSGPSATQS